MYIGLHVQYCRYSYQILIKLEFSRNTVVKYSYIKFHENPSSGNRVFPCGRTDGRMDRWTYAQTDMTQPIVASRNFTNAPNKNVKAQNIHELTYGTGRLYYPSGR